MDGAFDPDGCSEVEGSDGLSEPDGVSVEGLDGSSVGAEGHSSSPALQDGAAGHASPLPLCATVVVQLRVQSLLQALHSPSQLISCGHKP